MNFRHLTLATLPLLLTSTAIAQTPITGFAMTDDCSALVDNLAEEGELFAIKLAGSATTDWVFDVRTKGGGSAGLAELSSVGYLLPSNWTAPESANDDVFVFVTYAGGRLVTDSGNVGVSAGSFDLIKRQQTGNSLPLGSLQGIGLEIPQGAGQYPVRLRSGTKMFPFGASRGIEIALGTIADLQPTDLSGSGCSWGGTVADRNAIGGAMGQGFIRGYNIYRQAGPRITPPSAGEVSRPQNFSYFLDLRNLNLDAPDPMNDLNPRGDLLGIDNADGFAYTGDEVLFFSDQDFNPDGSSRPCNLPGPVSGQGYWYTIQPVVDGDVDDFASVRLAGGSAQDLRLDLDGDGLYDAVNLDPIEDPLGLSPEFISPQNECGQRGLGLTWHGTGLCNQLPFYGEMNPAPAVGTIRLLGTARGSRIELRLATEVETADILGYVVYRVSTRGRDQVAPLIAARGGEGSSYSLSDHVVGQSLRDLRAGSLYYEVEVLFNDGTSPEIHGPFTVQAGPRTTP